MFRVHIANRMNDVRSVVEFATIAEALAYEQDFNAGCDLGFFAFIEAE